jgi:hypothetical protein
METQRETIRRLTIELNETRAEVERAEKLALMISNTVCKEGKTHDKPGHCAICRAEQAEDYSKQLLRKIGAVLEFVGVQFTPAPGAAANDVTRDIGYQVGWNGCGDMVRDLLQEAAERGGR